MEAVDSMNRQTEKDRARGVGTRLSWQGKKGCDWLTRGKLLAARDARYVAGASKRPSLFQGCHQWIPPLHSDPWPRTGTRSLVEISVFFMRWSVGKLAGQLTTEDQER